MTDRIKELCGNNKECLYDVLTTGNEKLGKESAGFEEENQNLVNELGEQVPRYSKNNIDPKKERLEVINTNLRKTFY